MAVTLGSNGVLEANLIIPQSTTFACAIEHTDTEGTPIDHTGYTPYMRIIDKQKKEHDIGEYVSFDGSDVLIELPSAVTESLALGSGKYDLMLEDTSGRVVRLLYGAVSIIDTYSLDD